MQKYKCINDFELPVYDEDESMTDDYGKVSKDSIWRYDNGYCNCGNSEIRLYLEDGEDDFGYIDITRKHLEEYFVRVD